VWNPAGAGVEGEMIYAIRAVGTEYVKIGYTTGNTLGRRLEGLQTACPYPLEVLATCPGDHKAERSIHLRLFSAKAHHRGEWFRDCEAVRKIIEEMKADAVVKDESPSDVLKIWNCAVKRRLHLDVTQRKPGGWSESERQSRVGAEPALSLVPTEGTHDRLERIKQRALARKAAKRSQEAA
jgi:hypothetical protein